MGLVAACAVAGAFSALLVTRGSASEAEATERAERTVVWEPQAPGNHFTEYRAENYPDLTYAAENAVQGVVNIVKTEEVEQTGRMGGFDPFFEFFGIPQQRGYNDGRPFERQSGGSGVIISSDGYIVTNNHVVDNASKLKVRLYDRRTFDAEVIGTDPTTDVALIKIDAEDLPTIPFGDSDALRLGEWVLAIGSPYDLQNTITAGIVSAKARKLDVIPSQFRVESFIQTDAAVNPGNSGGALVNTRGELVGINTVIKSQTGSYIGYSFAVPMSIVKKVVLDLKEYGVVQRAMLGLTYQEINEAFLESEGRDKDIDRAGGIYVVNVDPDGAAYAAGIKKGDVIYEIDGQKIENSATLSEIMSRYRPNDKVKVSLKRDGKVKQIEVVLRNKAGKAELLTREDVNVTAALGGKFSDITDRTKKELKVDYGVRVLEVDAGGILARANVREGFVITHINERPIRSVSDLEKVTPPITLIEGVNPGGRAASYVIVQ